MGQSRESVAILTLGSSCYLLVKGSRGSRGGDCEVDTDGQSESSPLIGTLTNESSSGAIGYVILRIESHHEEIGNALNDQVLRGVGRSGSDV